MLLPFLQAGVGHPNAIDRQAPMQAPSRPALYRTYLRHLLHLRLVALGGQALAYFLVAGTPHITLPVLPLLAVGGGVLAHTLRSLYRLTRKAPVGERAILMETAVDLASLTLSLYMTGGANNPFVCLLLLPVTVATATLRPLLSWCVAGSAAGCYTLLMFLHAPLGMAHHANGAFELHVWGMWYGFLLSAVLVALFVARIGATVRAHDRALAKACEQALRTEKWLALGTLATGTAHELGTPLATMAVLATDLRDDLAGRPDLTEQLTILRSQIDRCKGILARMARDAGEIQADAGRPMALEEYLMALMEEWRAIRPGARVTTRWHGSQPPPRIVADRSLTQAIHNILNNAADASPHYVDVEATWDNSSLNIEIRDRGEGLRPTRDPPPEPVPLASNSEKSGLGLGLLLARTVLERLGGEVTLQPGKPSGVRARISLPLAPLLAAPER
jgi:two-component system sensor histidine kinase RegB